jgi:uncharacterized oxidoreductase
MQLVGHTILITGGSEGIGFELAKALAPDNIVIICGRSAVKLERAKSALPQVMTEVCDITDEAQRDELVERVLRKYPKLNILVNNAGSRHRIYLRNGDDIESDLNADLSVNFVAPVSLSGKLLKHLQEQPRAAIVNISTGLVYLPKATQPFYCAAKAALHSYTRSLRWALQNSRVRVFEVMMTLVDTNFHQGDLPRNIKAMSPREAARLTLEGILRDEEEIHIGKAALARWVALVAPKKGMAIVNK